MRSGWWNSNTADGGGTSTVVEADVGRHTVAATGSPAASPPPPSNAAAPPASSAWSRCARWMHASLNRASSTARASLLSVSGWGDDAELDCGGCGEGLCFPAVLPCNVAAWLRAGYDALPTTRVCAVVLPHERDSPLVLHLALLLVSLEAAQATAFYIRYRRAVRASATAMAAAMDAAEAAEADAEEPSDFSSTSVNTGAAATMAAHASPGPETDSARPGRPRLPRGSSRAMHRLCSYWSLLERAVRAAPRKRAGAPTTIAELSRIFRTDVPGADGDDGGAQGRFTSDGVPRGAETVLVLPDEAAFPPLALPPSPPPSRARSRPTSGTADDVSLAPHSASDSVASSTSAAEEPAEVAEAWEVLHLLWTDTVRYSVNHGELRQLLLGCTVAEIAKLFDTSNSGDAEGGWSAFRVARGTRVLQTIWRSMSSRNISGEAATAKAPPSTVDSPLHPSGATSFSAHGAASPTSQGSSPRRCSDPRVSVACLALTWYLALVREVYEAVMVHEDVQRCADALEELEEYNRAVYQHGIEVSAGYFETMFEATSGPCGDDQESGGVGGSNDSSRVARADGERAASARRSGDHHTLLLPHVVTAVDGAAPTVAVRGAPRGPLHGNNPLDSDVDDGPLTLLSSPRGRNECEAAAAAAGHAHVRVASPRACWAALTAALAALLRRRRLMELSHVRSLFTYMYTGSVAKLVAFTVLAALTGLTSRVAAVGHAAREAISTNLDTYYRGQGEAQHTECGSDAVPAQYRVVALCCLECTRLAVNTVLTHTTHEYITVAASQRRNTVKAELYEALTRLPLAFFDLHSYEEVEQIVYYVNDIEGVEVHVHHYICGLVTSLFAVRRAMRQLPRRARLLVGGTVAVSLGVKYVGRRVKKWKQTAQRTGGALPPWLRGCNLDGTVSATAELDAQVEENTESNARQGGVMLRGLDIIAVLPQLRPYAADLHLMRWWTDHTRACGAAVGATEATTFMQGLLVLPYQAYGKLFPAFGSALLTFADWVLPTLVASYGASMAFCGVDALSLSNRLIEAMRCVGDLVDAIVDGRRVAEVVLLNAYKASVLEKVLDPRRWEPTTAEHVQCFILGGEESRGGRELDSAAARRATVSGGADADQRRRLLRSFCRAESLASATSPPSLAVRCWRAVKGCGYWCITHVPPVLVVRGGVRLARRGLLKAGILRAHHRRRQPRQARRRSQKLRRHGRHGHRSGSGARHGVHRGVGVSAEAAAVPRSPQSVARDSVSEATEAYQSNGASEDEHDDGTSAPQPTRSSSTSSSSSYPATASCATSSCDDSDADSAAAAAAAAAAVLASASVYAVSVQNLQFHYPTAPTVPVFPRPITCTFVLQGGRETAPSTPSSPSPSPSPSPTARDGCGGGQRGRLVCLVGPSGHGKSTLLSLLLGMYTHYGASSHCRADDGDGSDGVGDDEEAGVAAGPVSELPFTPSQDVVVPDIVLTLALPHSASEAAEQHSARGVTPTSVAASAASEAVYEQLSVASIPRDILRGNLFSFVPQSPVIFSGATIAHNISLENFISLEQEALLAEIAQCAAWAHCEFIHRFPQGLMTYIADSGTGAWSSPLASAATGGGGAGGGGGVVRLSGGQAQRLMMARALFHGRRGGTVLVMDEPTASLDKEVKLEILEEWRELLDRGIVHGMICATHDDDLITVADEVVRLP
ncbi:hypothetical protein NESM_000731300 [Novymonas esmeraldas]|uniref:AAA+ ATPase domain-containing protein n=1 Tax=Novymonas esmeraldas TaxID=1808958 RepID=A0AAW0EVL5_9TRYP